MADNKKKKCLSDESLTNINGGVDCKVGDGLAPVKLSYSKIMRLDALKGLSLPSVCLRPWHKSEDQQTYNKGKMRL